MVATKATHKSPPDNSTAAGAPLYRGLAVIFLLYSVLVLCGCTVLPDGPRVRALEADNKALRERAVAFESSWETMAQDRRRAQTKLIDCQRKLEKPLKPESCGK